MFRVLFVQHSGGRSGSTISGLTVAEAFRETGARVEVVFGHDGPMIAAYRQLGCGTRIIEHKNWLRGGNWQQSTRRIAREVWNARRFRALLRELRPHVVYVNSLVSLSAAVAARRGGIPCVWHLRELFDDVGGEMRIPAIGGRGLVRQLLARLPARRIAISQSVADNLQGAGNTLPIEVISNAVDDTFFQEQRSATECRRHFELPEGRPIIGVPGTLRPVKGHTFLLDAAAQVVRLVPDCLFVITGSGEPCYEAELRSQAAHLGIQQQIRFIGTITEMPQFYRACSLVCIPSRSESFGRIAIEAFASGTPVVATAVGGMRETIEDGRTGLLVEYGDVAGLSAAIRELISDEQARADLVTNAARVAAERYSAGQIRKRIRNVVIPLIKPTVERDDVSVGGVRVPASVGPRSESH